MVKVPFDKKKNCCCNRELLQNLPPSLATVSSWCFVCIDVLIAGVGIYACVIS